MYRKHHFRYIFSLHFANFYNMTKAAIFILPAFIVFISSFCTSCKDKNCPDHLFYRIPYSLSPIKDTFNVGDTLRLEMNFRDELIDEIGNVKNIFLDYDFRIELQCGRIDSDPPLSNTSDCIDIRTIVGRDSSVLLPQSGVSFYKIIPEYSNKTYTFKCELVLKEKGLLYFGIVPFNTNADPFEISGECDHLPITIGSKLDNEAENNYHMLQWAANPVYHTFDEKRFSDYGGYCFVVK